MTFYTKISDVVAIVKFRYTMRKSISLVAFPRSADGCQYNNRNLYMHSTKTIWAKCLVAWYVSLVKTNIRSTYGKRERERDCVREYVHVCEHVWDVHALLVGENQ